MISWGILGTGRIAHTFARAVVESSCGELVAVASRARKSADRFGGEFDVARFNEGYGGLLDDPKATPFTSPCPTTFTPDGLCIVPKP